MMWARNFFPRTPSCLSPAVFPDQYDIETSKMKTYSHYNDRQCICKSLNIAVGHGWRRPLPASISNPIAHMPPNEDKKNGNSLYNLSSMASENELHNEDWKCLKQKARIFLPCIIMYTKTFANKI